MELGTYAKSLGIYQTCCVVLSLLLHSKEQKISAIGRHFGGMLAFSDAVSLTGISIGWI